MGIRGDGSYLSKGGPKLLGEGPRGGRGKQLRQLGDVGRNLPRLIFAEQLGR